MTAAAVVICVVALAIGLWSTIGMWLDSARDRDDRSEKRERKLEDSRPTAQIRLPCRECMSDRPWHRPGCKFG